MIDNKEFYFEALENGVVAEGIIAGCLRGGRLYQGYFASHGPVGSFHVQRVEDTRELKTLNQ